MCLIASLNSTKNFKQDILKVYKVLTVYNSGKLVSPHFGKEYLPGESIADLPLYTKNFAEYKEAIASNSYSPGEYTIYNGLHVFLNELAPLADYGLYLAKRNFYQYGVYTIVEFEADPKYLLGVDSSYNEAAFYKLHLSQESYEKAKKLS